MKKVLHVAQVIADGGRDGRVSSDTKALDLKLSTGGRPDDLTPEHLFAGAYAACFLGAVRNAAEKSHVTIEGLTVSAQVSLVEEKETWSLHVTLRASMPGLDAHRARHLMNLAHQTCPYSRALRGNVDVLLDTD